VIEDLAFTHHRFFTRIAAAVFNIEPAAVSANQALCEAFWHQVAFYNFVQFPMSDPTERPSRAQFVASSDAFGEVTSFLKPTHVWVCGSTLWRNMPYNGDGEWRFEDATSQLSTSFPIGRYYFRDHQFLAMPTHHPSYRRFSLSDAKTALSFFLNQAY